MPNNSYYYNQIYQAILGAEKILLVAHEKPDGDTLGATSAFSIFLDNLGKNYQIYCADPVPGFFSFLPNSHKFNKLIKEVDFDLIVALDCGDINRARLSEIFGDTKIIQQIINIDHHQSNPGFGQFNVVNPLASSTSEIIYNLFLDWKVPINKEIATALLNGLFTDTGAFVYSNTTLESLLIAGFLMNYGGRLKEISQYNFKNKSVPALKLWGRALERLVINKKYQIAYTIILKKDLEELAATEDDLEGLSNLFNNMTEIKASLVLKEDGEYIRGSLRTVNDEVNVSKLATIFGGGGHPKASGFKIKGILIEEKGKWRIE